MGLALAAHGAQKLFGAFGGDGIGGTARSFERIGLRPGKLHAWMAGTTELLGGLLIALGLVTPLAATALIAVMVVATLTVGLPNGFFVTSNGYEYNLVLAATLFALAGTRGTGRSTARSARSSVVASPPVVIPAMAGGTPSARPRELMAL